MNIVLYYISTNTPMRDMKETIMAKKVKEPKVVVQDPHAIPFNEQLAYGAGAFMDGGGVALMACILVKYMTSLGISFAIASTIFMVAKFWDAISDPIMGFISEFCHHKNC